MNNILLEIKWRSLYTFISFFCTLYIVWILGEEHLFIWTSPLFKLDSLQPRAFLCRYLTEAFSMQVWLFSISTVIYMGVLVIYQCLAFCASGFFYNRWKRTIRIIIVFFCNCISIWSLTFLFILPKLCYFLFEYQRTESLIPILLEPYLSSTLTIFVRLLSMEMFILMIISFVFEKLKKNMFEFKKYRLIYLYGSILVSGLICPPDLFSQIFTMMCLFFVYEILLIYRLYLDKVTIVDFKMSLILAQNER